MGKIGDLWVRLGLKSEEFKKGMEDASRQTEGFGGKLQGLKAGALAVWSALGVAVAKFASDFMTTTQTIGDKWNETMAGIRGGYKQFVATISSGEGWKNLFSNMREASRLAREAAKALDEVFERKTSFSYEEADTNRRIAEQRKIMMDASKSGAERKAAAKEIIRLEEELGKKKLDIYQQEAKAQRDNFKSQTLMNDEEIDFLVKAYNQNRDIISQARAYNEQKGSLKSGSFWGKIAAGISGGASNVDTSSINAGLADLEARTSDDVRRIAAMVAKYDKGNDALVAAMAQADVNAINVETETINSTIRANSTLGRLGGGASSSGSNIDDILFNLGLRGLSDIYSYVDDLEDVPPLELEPIKLKGLDKSSVDSFIEGVEELERRCEELAEEFKMAVVDGFGDGIQTLMDGMMGLEQLNAGSVLQALLEPLADLAIQQGKITMLQGVAIEAIGKSLKSLNGGAAIAAGAALIAVGAAAKAGLASLANSMGGSGASASSATTASASTTNSVTSEEIVVRVEGKISGNDILISGERTRNNWNR